MTYTREIRKIEVAGVEMAGLKTVRFLSGVGFECVMFEKGYRVWDAWGPRVIIRSDYRSLNLCTEALATRCQRRIQGFYREGFPRRIAA